MTITKEVSDALKIQAMMQGMTIEDLARQMFDEEEIIIEVDDDTKKEKKKSTSKKSEQKNKKPEIIYIEEKEQFSCLKVPKAVDVVFNGHNIEYKNQLWDISVRKVEYHTEVVKIPKRAKDLAEMFTPNSEEEKNRAANGDVRYIKLTSYSEALDFRIRDAGYAKVWENNGKLRFKIMLNKELKNHRANVDSVRKDFEDAMRELTA